MQRNFTLIELLVVIAIIGLMAGLILPRIGNVQEDAQTASGVYNARAVASQIESFRIANGKYPAKFHTGCFRLGKGYGYLGDPAYANDYSPMTGTGIGGQQLTGEAASEILPELSENVKLNLSRGVQLPVNSPICKSLAKAGISRVVFGNLDVLTVDPNVGLGGADQWKPSELNPACEILLYDANGTFDSANGKAGFLGVSAWEDAEGNQIVLGGRTIAQHLNQPAGDLKRVHRVAAFIVGPQVDWAAYYHVDGTYAGASKIGLIQTQNAQNYCVAFFGADMGDARNKIEPKPAVFLGCVDAQGHVLTR